MSNYTGDIIEESLENKEVLKKVNVLSTRIEKVTPKHRTPWLKQWTLHFVEVQENQAKEISEEASKSLDRKRGGSWYADFKNDTHHYIIFPGKVFYVDRASKEQYDEASRYGTSLGIPKYQIDFSPHVKKWDR